MHSTFMEVSTKLKNLDEEINKELLSLFSNADDICFYNQQKVIYAMQKHRLSDSHFTYASGYGYNDSGRDILEDIFADIFGAEEAICRPQIVSGTHALSLTLFSNLEKGDKLVSITGKPYDTLLGVIGVRKTTGSLIEKGINYKEIPLKDEKFIDLEAIKGQVDKDTKMCILQRSKGYSTRRTLTVDEINKAIEVVKSINENIIVMVDNCYGEFVEKFEPSDYLADLTVGSLIKNPGGGLAPIGGYVVGKSKYIERVAISLTAPGLGKEVGASLGMAQTLLQGLFLAPSVTKNALKNAMYASLLFEKLGFLVTPNISEKRSCIVQSIIFNDPQLLIAFCEGIQKSSPVDSYVVPTPWDMPGYDNQVIMAAGAFVQGSSIELSADAPIREPYVAYMQGGLTFEHGRFALLNTVQYMVDKGVLKI